MKKQKEWTKRTSKVALGVLFAHLTPALFLIWHMEICRIPTWLKDDLPSFEYFRNLHWQHVFKKLRETDSSPSSLLIWSNIRAFWKTTSTFQVNRDHHQFFIHIQSLHLTENPCSGWNSGIKFTLKAYFW